MIEPTADGEADERRRRRVEVLAAYGAEGTVAAELLDYNDNVFDFDALSSRAVPLDDEPHLEAWRDYVADAGGAIDALRRALVQLRFPIQEGISELPEYRAVTLSGELPELSGLATGLQLEHPEELRLDIVATAGGHIPVVTPCGRPDFIAVLRALACKNEPDVVPDSQGAATVAGLNNWDRIERYRAAWRAAHPDGDWDDEFQRLIPHRELYKDRFIILSDGPYSSVPAEALGLSTAEWRDLSIVIRMHHECTHYATSRLFGAMRNRALDEIIADYFGVTAATGGFRADWALRFLGLESLPSYREGGRLQNYRDDLSDEAFRVLQRLVHDAVRNLETFDGALDDAQRTARRRAGVLLALASSTVEELATPCVDGKLLAALERLPDAP